jgi:hypothetical protein
MYIKLHLKIVRTKDDILLDQQRDAVLLRYFGLDIPGYNLMN